MPALQRVSYTGHCTFEAAAHGAPHPRYPMWVHLRSHHMSLFKTAWQRQGNCDVAPLSFCTSFSASDLVMADRQMRQGQGADTCWKVVSVWHCGTGRCWGNSAWHAKADRTEAVGPDLGRMPWKLPSRSPGSFVSFCTNFKAAGQVAKRPSCWECSKPRF